MGSALLYKDLDNTSTQDMLVFCVSLLCVAIGVALVSKREGAQNGNSSAEDEERDKYDNVRCNISLPSLFGSCCFRPLLCHTLHIRPQVPLLAAIDEGDINPRASAKKASLLVL
jgi:hypothetical protein